MSTIYALTKACHFALYNIWLYDLHFWSWLQLPRLKKWQRHPNSEWKKTSVLTPSLHQTPKSPNKMVKRCYHPLLDQLLIHQPITFFNTLRVNRCSSHVKLSISLFLIYQFYFRKQKEKRINIMYVPWDNPTISLCHHAPMSLFHTEEIHVLNIIPVILLWKWSKSLKSQNKGLETECNPPGMLNS